MNDIKNTREYAVSLATHVLVFPRNIDLARAAIPTRGYDFNKGDRRFVDQDRAIEHALEKAKLTGVRQVVRVSGAEPGSKGRPFHLVQAIGS